MKNILNNAYILSILFLSIFTILPFLNSGFFTIHDNTQVERVFEMHKSLSDGQFPVRWVQDLGYGFGYPIFNYYSPLPYYIGSLFMFLNLNALIATKISFIFPIIFSGIFVYFLVKEFFGKIPAVVSSIVYVYFPYHAVNIYVRGDLDELYSYAFLPLVFLGFYKIFNNFKEKPNFKYNLIWIILSSLSIALVITSHNLSSYMLLIFLSFLSLILFVFSQFKPKIFLYYFLSMFLGLLISSFYSIPAIFEMQYTNVLSQVGGGADFKDHFVCIDQLWDSPWGFGGSTKSCLDGLSFKLGKLNILLIILSLSVFIFSLVKQKMKFTISDYVFISSFILLVFSIFMTTSHSLFIWNLIPEISFLQYPWRFLNFVSLFAAIVVGFFVLKLFTVINKHIALAFVFLIILITIFYNLKLFTPQKYNSLPSSYYTNVDHIMLETSKISDEYLPKDFKKPLDLSQKFEVAEFVSGQGQINTLENKTNYKKISFILTQDSAIKFNVAYFPAWQVFINDEEKKLENKEGKLYLLLSKDSGIIELKFTQTPIEKISNALSLIGICIIFIGIINIRLKRISKDS